ncbi:hypothetical protein [Oceanobacillus massiliensis]|uniref:hypothetical protein n=1 Tax=Oceanobacillus massiliensis TaxID=1465765 RepID=UPI0002880A61|nr:hypothetical protein [Oceanobacillus massiliensis]
MKIVGMTEIVLTDINTGEIESIKDENMVTNAVTQVFDSNIEGMFFNIGNEGGTTWTENILPIAGYAMGGILLFNDPLVENVNNIYAPTDNPCIGYANMEVNPNANTMRGSLNIAESGKIENGYKYVWDFATSQANGTISAISLTHRNAGIGYWGDAFRTSSKLLEMKNAEYEKTGEIASRYIDVVEVNFEGNYFYSISMDNTNQILIKKIRKCFRQIGLNFTLLQDGDEILETISITPSEFINPNASSNYGYFDFFDGEDGFWYGFLGTSNSSGSAKIKWIKIKKSDYSFTEGSWTLTNAQIYQIGYHVSYASNPYRYVQSAMRNGYLYVMKYDKTGMYKINANNSADITEISFGFTSSMYAPNYSYTYIFRLSDIICGSDFIIYADDRVQKTANGNPLEYCCTPVFQYGPYGITFGRKDYGGYKLYKGLWLITPYLATINNLSTAVTKTADKTMKITYLLHEIQ